MGTQLKVVSKEEAHKLIDSVSGDSVVILTYTAENGISNKGKTVNKKRSKKLVDDANLLVLAESNPIRKLDMHMELSNFLNQNKKKNIIKSILLPKLE